MAGAGPITRITRSVASTLLTVLSGLRHGRLGGLGLSQPGWGVLGAQPRTACEHRMSRHGGRQRGEVSASQRNPVECARAGLDAGVQGLLVRRVSIENQR